MTMAMADHGRHRRSHSRTATTATDRASVSGRRSAVLPQSGGLHGRSHVLAQAAAMATAMEAFLIVVGRRSGGLIHSHDRSSWWWYGCGYGGCGGGVHGQPWP